MEDKETRISNTIVAIYSSNIETLGHFYKAALDLQEIEKSDDYICLAKNGIEINIIKMNGKTGKEIKPEEYLHIREETPIKCSFVVDSFEQVIEANERFGGMLKDKKNAWEWRRQLHLDGYDPEGNVLQYRKVIDC